MAKTSKKNRISPMTQMIGIIMIAVAALLLLIAVFGNILGPVGSAIRHFFLGAFGLSFYAFNAAMLSVGIAVLGGARPVLKASKIALIVSLYFVAVLALHMISIHSMVTVGRYEFGAHMRAVYAYDGVATFGGVIASVIVYPLATLITPVASYLLYALIIGAIVYAWFGFRPKQTKTNFKFVKSPSRPAEAVSSAPPVQAAPVRPKREEVLFVRNPDRAAPQGFGDVGTHSLFVDTVAAAPQEIAPPLPKVVPAPRFSAQGRPLSEKAHGSLYSDLEPVEPFKREPMDAYMPDYITKKADKKEPSAPRPEVVSYPATESRRTEETPAEPRRNSVIIDGESRSKELEDAKKREEKIAQAEKKLIDEQTRRATEPVAPRPAPNSGKLIMGDEESERILSKRAVQDAAAAKFAHATPVAPAPEQPKRLFAAPVIDGSARFEERASHTQADSPRPTEIKSGPAPKFSDIVARDVKPSDEEKKETYVVQRDEAPKPTDGFDFNKVFGASAAPAREPAQGSPAQKRDDFSLFGLLGGKRESAPAREEKADDILFFAKPAPLTPAPVFETLTPAEPAREDYEEETEEETGKKVTTSAQEDAELSPFAFLDAIKPAPSAPVSAASQPIRVAEPDEEDAFKASQENFDAEEADRDYLPPTTDNIRKVSSDPKVSAREQLRLDDYKQAAEETVAEEDDEALFPTSDRRFEKPPIDLLYNTSTYTSEVTEEAVERGNALVDKLKEFKIPCEVCGICRGPAVSRYELQMADGVSVNKVKGHADDIAYALAVTGGVRIEAPVPGKRAVGVEVPNESIGIVSLREIMESEDFVNAKSPLAFAVGTDVAGKKIICDLGKMPHLLVAGTTGSGKSSCLNSLIISMISRTSPEDVRLLLIDPKRVEFAAYDGLPHMLLRHAITEWGNALNALQWLIDEYERRFKLFQKMRVRDLTSYNAHADVRSGKKEKLPYLVVIIDEMADLIFNSKQQFEDKIRAIAQKARAAGIHMVIATQRPSTDVITGTIKANLGSRIAFAVTNYTDSRVILDQGGAENLLGRGDMLYAPQNFPDPIRVQGAFITDEERDNVINFIQEHNESVFDERVERAIYPAPAAEDETVSAEGDASEFDELTLPVLWYFIETGKSSISSVQRKFRVGFNRAASIVDDLEVNQFIGSDGISKERTVLLTKEEFIARFGNPTWQ